jgi:translocator protein
MTNWRWINVAVFVLVLVANGAAGSGALSGQSIGAIANQYASLFLPANYVFGIWSIIYIGQFTVLLHMVAPSSRGNVALERMGPWWTIAGALNIAWVVLFSFAQFHLAMLVMLGFLAALIVIGERVRAGEIFWLDRALLIWPFDIYLAWISVAVIANAFQLAHVVGFGGLGIPEDTWSPLMMAVASVLAVLMARLKGNWLFPVVVAWAIHGIGVRYADLPAIAMRANLLVPAVLTVGGVALVLRGRASRRPGAA